MNLVLAIKKKIRTLSVNFFGLILPITILIIWCIMAEGNLIPNYKIPSPNALIKEFIDFAIGRYNESPYSKQLIINLSASIKRVGIGFLIAILMGVPLGFLTGRIKLLKKLLDPMINAIRSIPGIGWLPIAIVWFGVGQKNTLFLMSLAAFFPIYLNTQSGAIQVSPMLIRAGHMLGAKKLRLFITVIFPAAFPNVLVGLRMGLGVAWGYLVLGEMTGVDKGIGAIMSDARMLGNVDIIIICMFIIGILGKLTDWLLLKICSLFYHKEEMNKNSGE